MLEIVPLASRASFSAARSLKLASDVSLIIWDIPGPCAAPPRCTRPDGEAIAPLTSLRLTRLDGGTRIVWGLRLKELTELSLSAGTLGPSDVIEVDPGEPFVPSDLQSLIDDVDGRSRIALLTALLTSWSGAFRLSRSPSYAEALKVLANELQPGGAQAALACRPTKDTALIEFVTSADLGTISSGYVIASQGMRRLSLEIYTRRPDRNGKHVAVVLVHGDVAGISSGTLVLIGDRGTAIRTLAANAKAPAEFMRWWAARRSDAGLAEFLVRTLSGRSEEARLAVIDMQARAAVPAKAAEASAFQPGGEVDLALSLDGGLLAGGWFRDPGKLVAGIDHVSADSKSPLETLWHLFPGRVAGSDGEKRDDAMGFIAYLPHDKPAGPILQPRFRMRLKSGAELPLIPRPQPVDAATMRAGVLRSVPLQHAGEELLANTLGPALAEIQKRLVKSVTTARTVDFGTPIAKPLYSIVIPLYRVLDYLRFQIAAFATDPDILGRAQIIYVLDSPEQADDVIHLLGGLYKLYRLPMTLVVMSGNGGYARANNAGVEIARGSVVALVNSDVIPSGGRWLKRVSERLGGQARVGAVGPKLLFEDDSLQHAGLYFERDHRGTWLNHHFYKGMPSGHPPANKPRLVPGVTGACLVTQRELFLDVGGFTEDYVIGDYEDSDLCLKIREAGRNIAYEPAVSLYHLERRSMRRNGDYTRGIASRYNSWLHTQRWDPLIIKLMGEKSAATSTRSRRSAA